MDANKGDSRSGGGLKRKPSDTPLPHELADPAQPGLHNAHRRRSLQNPIDDKSGFNLQAALKALVSSHHFIQHGFDDPLMSDEQRVVANAPPHTPWPATGTDDAAGYGLTELELAALTEDVESAVHFADADVAARVTPDRSLSLPASGAQTTLAVGSFDWGAPGLSAVFGGHDAGRLGIAQLESHARPIQYETKQATITALLAFSLFPHSAGGHDLITGDAHGECRVFSVGKCVAKRHVGAAVTSLHGITDMLLNQYVLAGDAAGMVTAFDALHIRWRVRVGGMGYSPHRPPLPPSPSITSIVHITLSAPLSAQLTFIADGAPGVQVFVGNTRIRTITMPSAITTMAAGSFRPGPGIQVLAAGADGDVFIIDGATLAPARYLPIWSTVTHIQSLPAMPRESGEQAFVVAGRFCQLRIYKGQKVMNVQKLSKGYDPRENMLLTYLIRDASLSSPIRHQIGCATLLYSRQMKPMLLLSQACVA
ncbi:hypothetical protein HDU86_004356 [Geranomyces michiganensis]|nr:hypothetical protein HDU86_004356 [Geranomyces michiganensis]